MKKLILLLVILLSACTAEPVEVDMDEAIKAYLDEHIEEYISEYVPETEVNMNGYDLSDMVSSVFEKVDESVFLVANVNDLGTINGVGSAVVYKKEDGYYFAVTNNHVVEGSYSLRAYFEEHNFIDLELVGTDSETDVAVIKFKDDGEEDVAISSFGNIEDLRVGQMVLAVGSPSGLTYYNSATLGMISGLDRFIGLEDLDGDGIDDIFVRMLQHDAAINPGNSGGPLFNLDGEIIGINTIKLVSDDIEGMGFSIYLDVVNRVIGDLEEFGEVQATRLGVWIFDARYSDDAPEGVEEGAVIAEIVEGEAVDTTSDLQVNDTIVEFGGVRIEGLYRLKHELFLYHPGDVVEVKYIREGVIRTTTIVLGRK